MQQVVALNLISSGDGIKLVQLTNIEKIGNINVGRIRNFNLQVLGKLGNLIVPTFKGYDSYHFMMLLATCVSCRRDSRKKSDEFVTLHKSFLFEEY